MGSNSGGTDGTPPDNAGVVVPGPPRAGRALLITLAMAQFMVVLDFTIVNVALPSIQHGLHVATTTLQWLVSPYFTLPGPQDVVLGEVSSSSMPTVDSRETSTLRSCSPWLSWGRPRPS